MPLHSQPPISSVHCLGPSPQHTPLPGTTDLRDSGVIQAAPSPASAGVKHTSSLSVVHGVVLLGLRANFAPAVGLDTDQNSMLVQQQIYVSFCLCLPFSSISLSTKLVLKGSMLLLIELHIFFSVGLGTHESPTLCFSFPECTYQFRSV